MTTIDSGPVGICASHDDALWFSEVISNMIGIRYRLSLYVNCWEQIGGIIALEYDYLELFAEHFKTVACYNLQHPAQFTNGIYSGNNCKSGN